MQDIWRDCTELPDAFNIENQYFLNYEMCLNGLFSKIQAQIVLLIQLPH